MIVHMKDVLKFRLWSCSKILSIGMALSMFCGCSLTSSRAPSTLVIMVEQLGFHSISCAEGLTDMQKTNPWQGISGFQILCNEAVRFTHAYTPSTLSLSAAASIFTSKYPLEHGLRSNGNQFLSATQHSIAESAAYKNFRTSFFSGGPPFFRKSGLNQGFELFDDNIQVSLHRFYRPAVENIKAFLNWHEQEGSRKSFFSTLYLADLQFEDVPTTNALGEVRENSFASQIEYVDEALGTLFLEMKKRKIWDSTHIVVVGLNGHGSEDFDEIRPLNLYGEGSHVSLFIKPAGEMKKPIGNMDMNVSLVDLGATLFDWIGEKAIESNDEDQNLKAISLREYLKAKPQSEEGGRMILTESAWSKWRKLGEMRYAIRMAHFLVFNDKILHIFDSLVENSELHNLGVAGLATPTGQAVRSYFMKNQLSSFEELDPKLKQKFALAHDLWRGVKPTTELLLKLSKLSQKYPRDSQLLNWKAIWDLKLDRWKELKNSAKIAQNPIWSFVAARNLKEKAEVPNDPCLNLIKEYSNANHKYNIRDCRAEEISELLSWLDESQTLSSRQKSMENFMRLRSDKLLYQKIAELNFFVGMNWDVSLAIPKEPLISDLILALPENRKYRQVVSRRLGDLGTN
jgi:hypothetical protein